jgi:adenosylhomocysteine nucleosidase
VLNTGGETRVDRSAVGDGAQVHLGRPAASEPTPGRAPEPTPRRAELGVITVLSEEASALREVFGLTRVQKGGLPFMEGRLPASGSRTIRVAATRSLEMGPRSTVLAFENLRHHYAPALIALTGIGGGIGDGGDRQAKIGDVVIATRVVYYDHRRETPEGTRRRGESPEAPAAIRHALNDFFTDYGEPAEFDDPGVGTYRVHTGPIGSGDAVITDSDSEITDYLRRFNERTLAVEMEGGGLSQAFHEQSGGTPVRGWVVIRGISDDASEAKGHDHHRLAARRAAQALRRLVPYLPLDEA